MAAKIKGIAFPFQRGPEGIPAMTENSDVVKSDLLLLFGTSPGSRVMRPRLAIDVASIIFDNTGPLLRAYLIRAIAEGMAKYEPRANLLSIGIDETNTMVTVDIGYEVFGETDSLTMVYSKESGSLTKSQ